MLAKLEVPDATKDSDLESKYQYYVSNVSRADMAASLECIILLQQLFELLHCRKALDLGSGFSSYIFRKTAESSHASVWSVDDDENWMAKTRSYLIQEGVGFDNLMTLPQFLSVDEKNFDLVFLDLNFVEVRKNYIALAINACRTGGIIVFDDVHKPDYFLEVLLCAKELNVDLFDARTFSLDRFGRYSIIGVKRK